MGQDLLDQETVARFESPFQSSLQLWDLGTQATTSECGQHLWILLSANEGIQHISSTFPKNVGRHCCQVTQDMETISRMPRFWSALSGSTGKLSCTISADELDSWVLFEPHCS